MARLGDSAAFVTQYSKQASFLWSPCLMGQVCCVLFHRALGVKLKLGLSENGIAMVILSFEDVLALLYNIRGLFRNLDAVDSSTIQRISLQKDFTNLDVETSQDVHWKAAAKLFERNKQTNEHRHAQ